MPVTRDDLDEIIDPSTFTGADEFINVVGDEFDSLNSRVGILEGNQLDTWNDLIANFSAAKGNGITEPQWQDIGNGIYGYKWTAGDELAVSFHITHDYKAGTDVYPHIHFFSDSVEGAGDTVTWRINYIVARGHSQGDSLSSATTQIDMVYTYDGTEVAGEHIVLECSDAHIINCVPSSDLLS